MIQGLAACFTGLEDPRETSRCDHQFIHILVIAVCAVIACAESWEDIALYGRCKQAWLKSFLALPNGIPSHDTFGRVSCRGPRWESGDQVQIRPTRLKRLSQSWLSRSGLLTVAPSLSFDLPTPRQPRGRDGAYTAATGAR